MSIPESPSLIAIVPYDIRIDDVDSGAPLLTITPLNEGPRSYRLHPDTVRVIVDTLAGTVRPEPGEVRAIMRGALPATEVLERCLKAMGEGS